MDRSLLAERFEAERGHLRAVAFGVLGSLSETDDAVQEAWIRLNRSQPETVNNLRGWLTTVVARVALDMLRSRHTRREEPLDVRRPGLVPASGQVVDPEEEAMLADSIGLALLVVLNVLTPAERVAFVLHDLFAVPFRDIGSILNRSSAAAKQLAMRARRRVEQESAAPAATPDRQAAIVAAFLAASRHGDFAGLLALLDPHVTLRADPAAVEAGTFPVVLGATAVAGTLSGRARAARLAVIDDAPGAVWAPGGRPRAVFQFTILNGLITAITVVAEEGHIDELDLSLSDAALP